MVQEASERADRYKTAFSLFLVLALLGTVLYFRTFDAPFLFDDRTSIAENDLVKDFPKALSAISQKRYVGTLTFAFNYATGGLGVYGYHLTNVVIHIANAFLVYLFVMMLAKSPAANTAENSAQISAFLAAFLFISHPLHTQAVSYISQRFTSLATFFYLVSVCCYIRARNIQQEALNHEKHGNPAMKLRAIFGIAVIAAVLAMKTKEIAATLPMMMIAIEFFIFRNRKRGVLPYAVMILVFAASVVFFALPAGLLSKGQTFQNIVSGVSYLSRETDLIPRTDYFVTQLRVIMYYLRLFLFPVNQNIDHVVPIYRSIADPAILASLTCLGALLGTAVWARRGYPVISFGIVWFFIALSVESSIIPIKDVMNEHRMYLPSVGLILSGLTAGTHFLKSQGVRIALISIIVLLFSVATFMRNETWRDPERLWADAISKAPYNVRAYNNLGTVYKERKEYEKAERQFAAALQINKTYVAAIYNLGDVQYQRGKYDEALTYLIKAETYQAEPLMRMDILNKLGRTYGALKRLPDAIEALEKARKEFPSSTVTLNNLGVQYIKNDEPDKAIAVLQQALRIREEYSLYANLSVAYAKKGEITKGEEMYWKAVNLREAKNL